MDIQTPGTLARTIDHIVQRLIARQTDRHRTNRHTQMKSIKRVRDGMSGHRDRHTRQRERHTNILIERQTLTEPHIDMYITTSTDTDKCGKK